MRHSITHTEKHCNNLDNLDLVKAIRAIHEAHLQLSAMGSRVVVDGVEYDNAKAMQSLFECMSDAGFN